VRFLKSARRRIAKNKEKYHQAKDQNDRLLARTLVSHSMPPDKELTYKLQILLIFVKLFFD
jgi:hypothetical protein